MNKPIGRILSSKNITSRAEFEEEAVEGMLVAVQVRGNRYLGRIDRLEILKLRGLIGYIIWFDILDRPLRSMTEIFIADEEYERGFLELGVDLRGLPIKIGINPLFAHMLIAGMTTVGKTHLMIILNEELGPHKVPMLVIDPQGEFIYLPELDRDRYILVEDLRIENLIPYLQQRKIVIYNLLGYTKKEKVMRVGALLEELMNAKERDYQQADDMLLLKLPPTIVMIDEADLFAPNIRRRSMTPGDAVESMIDIMERGAKFGLGVIVSTQRITRLDIDVRSQCNSSIIFRMIDAGSIQAVHGIDYIPKSEVEKVRALRQGQCLLAGIIVRRPRRIFTRDIRTRRAKERDFEKMLGIVVPDDDEEYASRLTMTPEGDIVDEKGIVVHDGLDRFNEENRIAFERDESGDGVILRGSHLSPEDQRLLNRLRKEKDGKDRLIG